MRTLTELERDLAQHECDKCLRYVLETVENGEATYAGQFARALYRNGKRLRAREAAVRNEQRRKQRQRLHLRVVEIDRVYSDDNGLRVDMRSELTAMAA